MLWNKKNDGTGKRNYKRKKIKYYLNKILNKKLRMTLNKT